MHWRACVWQKALERKCCTNLLSYFICSVKTVILDGAWFKHWKQLFQQWGKLKSNIKKKSTLTPNTWISTAWENKGATCSFYFSFIIKSLLCSSFYVLSLIYTFYALKKKKTHRWRKKIAEKHIRSLRVGDKVLLFRQRGGGKKVCLVILKLYISHLKAPPAAEINNRGVQFIGSDRPVFPLTFPPCFHKQPELNRLAVEILEYRRFLMWF